ncbi:MAG: hypothetical protein K2H90_04950 [Oscillospiraceae bacterium]|nr:hypothetical protein [Oscillospiraceae bacterium]
MEFSEILMTVITALVGIIGFFVKRAYDSLNEKATKAELEEAKKDIEVCKTDISKIKDNYLTKDDFFREQTKTEKKLDDMLKILMDMSRGGKS